MLITFYPGYIYIVRLTNGRVIETFQGNLGINPNFPVSRYGSETYKVIMVIKCQ